MSGRRGRGRGRGSKLWRSRVTPYPPPRIIRPIFDWTEVGDHFPRATPPLDTSLLSQLLTKRIQEITPSSDEQAIVQGFCTKVISLVENMILTGEGENLVLDEIRLVGSHKKGDALAGNMVADLVVLLREVPTEALVSNLSDKLVELLNSSQKTQVTYNRLSPYVFELINSDKAVTRIMATSTGDKVYQAPYDEELMKPFTHALRMIRHAKWWEDNTSHIKIVRSLVRILKDLQRHVPGLSHLNSWYIELLCNCAMIPLRGDEPLSIVDSFRRIFMLLSAGLFLPGSIGIPDPCEESDDGIHDNLALHHCDELTRNAQTILQLLHLGAFKDVLHIDGASANFTDANVVGEVTISVAQPVCEKAQTQDIVLARTQEVQ
ncbi:hypothetical protein EMCRGX_G030095 [Ephydatia muelleri]